MVAWKHANRRAGNPSRTNPAGDETKSNQKTDVLEKNRWSTNGTDTVGERTAWSQKSDGSHIRVLLQRISECQARKTGGKCLGRLLGRKRLGSQTAGHIPATARTRRADHKVTFATDFCRMNEWQIQK